MQMKLRHQAHPHPYSAFSYEDSHGLINHIFQLWLLAGFEYGSREDGYK